MTIVELIEKLNLLDPELQVIISGTGSVGDTIVSPTIVEVATLWREKFQKNCWNQILGKTEATRELVVVLRG